MAEGAIGTLNAMALKLGEAALIARFPFLAWPGLRQIWEFFLEHYETEVVKNFQDLAAKAIITISDKIEGDDAKKAAEDLSNVQNNPTATPEEKQAAKQAFADKYARLGRDRVATP